MRVDGAWKHAEAVQDPRGPIWPSATSIQGFLPGLGRFQVRGRGRGAESRSGVCVFITAGPSTDRVRRRARVSNMARRTA